MRVPEDADRDFTASAYVVKDGEVLFMKHSKTGYWLQPGGHIEENETPDEAARRETREETGFRIDFMDRYLSESSCEQSENLPQPFHVNLHEISDGHHHCDFCFLAEPLEENKASHGHEHDGTRWLSRQEIENGGYDMPENVRKTALKAIREAER